MKAATAIVVQDKIDVSFDRDFKFVYGFFLPIYKLNYDRLSPDNPYSPVLTRNMPMCQLRLIDKDFCLIRNRKSPPEKREP
jgi:hypothetical protein